VSLATERSDQQAPQKLTNGSEKVIQVTHCAYHLVQETKPT